MTAGIWLESEKQEYRYFGAGKKDSKEMTRKDKKE